MMLGYLGVGSLEPVSLVIVNGVVELVQVLGWCAPASDTLPLLRNSRFTHFVDARHATEIMNHHPKAEIISKQTVHHNGYKFIFHM